MQSRPSRRPRTPAGFTIIEVMMAAAILVVGFMGMIQAVTIGSEMLATARRQTLANQIITHEIERLRLKRWDDTGSTDDIVGLASSPATAYTSDAPGLNAAIAASGVSFSLATEVTTLTADSDLREVKFTVQWTKSGTTTAATVVTGTLMEQLAFARSGPIARTYTRSMTAYFGKYGLNLNTQRS